MSTPHLFVGLDAGGTKTRLLARHEPSGDTVVRTGPAANLVRQGLDGASGVLASLIQSAQQQVPGAALSGVCAGVAGAGEAADQARLADALRHRLGDAAPEHILIVHDAHIALEGAFEGGSGMILIAGTGSALFARSQDGTLHRAGGWGYLIGDEGSGNALGVHALRAVTHAMDGGPATRLQALLAEHAGIDTAEALKHQIYEGHWPVQDAAPLLLEAAEADDEVAQGILAEQTAALARQAGWLARRTAAIDQRVALLGGLSHVLTYRHALIAALTTTLPGWTITDALHPPEAGALRLAMAGR